MIAQLAILAGMVLIAYAVGIFLVRNTDSPLGRWAGDVLVIWTPAAAGMIAVVEGDLGPTIDQWLLVGGFVATAALGFTSKHWGREYGR
jgi:hypothetical protein